MVKAHIFKPSRPYLLLVTIERARNSINENPAGLHRDKRTAGWKAQRKLVLGLVREIVHDDIPYSAIAIHRQPIPRDAGAAEHCNVRVSMIQKAAPGCRSHPWCLALVGARAKRKQQ